MPTRQGHHGTRCGCHRTQSSCREGKSPALASTLRQALEVQFGPEYGALVNILGALRDTVLASGRPDDIIANESVRRVYLGEHFRM